MIEKDLILIGEATKSIQNVLDSLPCVCKSCGDDNYDSCNSEDCRFYQVCCNLVEARDRLEWILLNEEIEDL